MVAAIRGKLRILGQEIGEFGFFSQRNADHKKGFAPRSEKSRLFLWGFTRGRWCPVDTVQRRPNRQVRLPQHCGESLPRTRAKLPERVREKKEQASWFGCYREFVAIVRGETVGKIRVPPPPSDGRIFTTGIGGGVSERQWRSAANRPRRQPRQAFPTLAGFVVKGDALHSSVFTCLLSCFPPAFPPRCLAQNTRKTTRCRDRPLFPALPPADTAQRAFPGEAARLLLPPGGQLRR